MLALALDANACLSWRQVQDLVVRASNREHLASHGTSWTTNGANLTFSHHFGFGLLNAEQLVLLAKQQQHQYPLQARAEPATRTQRFTARGSQPQSDAITIRCPQSMSGREQSPTPSGDGSSRADGVLKTCVSRVEHVVVRASFQTTQRGAMRLVLSSPAGTTAELLTSRPLDRSSSSSNSMTWEFSTVAFWGESSEGQWVLKVLSSSSYATHTITSWKLTVFGVGAGLDLGGPTASRRTLTLHSGRECSVCPPHAYPDGVGGCRACSSSCSSGCFGPGRHDCLPSSSSSSPLAELSTTDRIGGCAVLLGALCFFSSCLSCLVFV